jgi:O-antigen/teichoic acid export membrane protein
LKGNQIAATAHLKPYASGTPRTAARRGFLHHSANHLAAWADQAVVSATSFLALIMLGRWTDASQLGAYATAVSVLAVLLAAQESLITRPYAIQLDQLPGQPAEHAFSSLVLSVLLSVAASGVLSAAALGLSTVGAHQGLPEMVWILAAATPFVLIREFARRFAFARLKVFHVLIVDGAVAAVNVALLCWLSWTGRLSALTALGATGISCAIGSLGWFYVARGEFAFRFGLLRTTLKASWGLGKWLLSGQIALQVQGYVAYWFAMVIAGATVTGIYAACMSIISFANPMLFGFFNILTPKSVRALRSDGGAGLRRQAVIDSLFLGALMSVFCAFVVLAGEKVMGLLYPGAEYRGHSQILTVLALSALVAAIGVPASIALASTERTRAVAAVMTFTAVLNVALTWMLMTHWGLLGAAYAVLIAEGVGSVGRWFAFLALVPGDGRLDPDGAK